MRLKYVCPRCGKVTTRSQSSDQTMFPPVCEHHERGVSNQYEMTRVEIGGYSAWRSMTNYSEGIAEREV